MLPVDVLLMGALEQKNPERQKIRTKQYKTDRIKRKRLQFGGAFDIQKLLKRYLTLTTYICGNLYN
jgi:hypothetical protein